MQLISMYNNRDYGSYKNLKRKKSHKSGAVGLFIVLLVLCAGVAFISYKPQIMNFLGTSVSNWTQIDKTAAAKSTAVATDNLHLRSEAGTSADILSTLPEGTNVTVLDSSDKAWTKVKTADGIIGWCSSQYLALGAETSSNDSAPSSKPESGPDVKEANGKPEISNVTLADAVRPLSVSVSLTNQQVMVLDSESRTVKTFTCSSGKAGSETPTGDFTVSDRGKSFFNKSVEEGAYYWVRFYNSYLFHSVPFDSNRKIEKDEADKLGAPASHGCLRLSIENAKWIYDNIPDGTKVCIKSD